MKRMTISILTLLVLFPIASRAQQRTDVPPPPAIIVSGNAEIEAIPDTAMVQLGIVRQSPSAQIAQEQANIVAKEILAAIAKVGIDSQRIRTSRLTLIPVYAPQ